MTARQPVPRLADSVTQLTAEDRGAVVVCGSHGGRFAALAAARAGVAAIVLHDASVGRDDAGIVGLEVLEAQGIPAAAVDHRTARIGSAREVHAAGVLSHCNAAAAALGCRPGQPARDAAALLAGHGEPAREPGATLPEPAESRTLLAEGPPPVWGLDSASLAEDDDAGAVVVTGSHGQLVGDDAAAALKADALAAVFNDAGGVVAPSRLEALDARGIGAVAVTAASARIGDARSSYADGIVSAANPTAEAQGAELGAPVRDYIAGLAAAEVAR